MIERPLSPYQIRGTNWVWRSSEQSVANQQISVLAIVEITLSMLVFWWFASTSPWPLLTLLAFLAVPLLLLRSPDSVNAGQMQLNQYWSKPDHEEFNLRRFLWWGLPITAIVITVASMITDHYLQQVGDGSIYVALRIVQLVGLASLGLIMFGALAGLGISPGTGISVYDDVEQFEDVGAKEVVQFIFLLPGLVLGLWIRATIIRFAVTSRHVSAGLANFSKNCYESIAVVDCCQMPQLMPGASSVHPYLNAKVLWRLSIFKTGWPKFLTEFWKIALLVCLLLPATLYRINIKANAWLWATLVWAIQPRHWGFDHLERTRLATLTNTVVRRVVLVGFLFLAALLGKAWLPELVLESIRAQANAWEWLKALMPWISSIDIPLLSLRYASLAMLMVSLAYLLSTAFAFGNANQGVLTNPVDWMQLDQNGEAEPVREAGLKVLSALKLTLVSVIFTFWIFAFWAVSNTAWGKTRFPHAVWDWIRPYL
jgi:hypothetical protein